MTARDNFSPRGHRDPVPPSGYHALKVEVLGRDVIWDVLYDYFPNDPGTDYQGHASINRIEWCGTVLWEGGKGCLSADQIRDIEEEIAWPKRLEVEA